MAAENFKVKRGLEVGTGTTITSGGVDITGIITAVQFKGDGSGLTGVVGSGSGVIIKDEGSTVGTAGTINFVGSDVSTAISEGTATVTVGVSTANVVTDSLNVSGVSTFNALVKLPDSTNNQTGRLMFGDNDSLQIFHTGSVGEIGNFAGNLNIKSNGFRVFNGAANQSYIIADQNSSVSIAFSGTNKLSTTGYGITVFGTTETQTLNVSGISTFNNGLVINDTSPFLDFIQTSGTNSSNRYRLRQTSGELFVQISTNNGASYSNAVSIGGIGNIFIPDNDKVFFGTNNDAYIQHDNSNLNVINTTGKILITGITSLTDSITIGTGATLAPNGNANFSGIVTATSFSGLHVGNVQGNATSASSCSGNSVTATTATNVTVADESTDTTCFLLFTTDATGNLPPKSGTNLTFNSSTGQLNATKFVGDGSGLTDLPGGGSYGNNDVDTHLNTSTASNGEVLSWNGSDYDWVAQSGGSGISTANVVTDTLNVSGVSTFVGLSTFNSNIFIKATTDTNQLNVSGVSTFSDHINISGRVTCSAITINDGQPGLVFEDTNADPDFILQNRNGSFAIRDITSSPGVNRFFVNAANGDVTVTGNIVGDNSTNISGIASVTATSFHGSGALLTSLNADNLGSGEIPNGRFPATLPAVSGANLTNLPAANLTGTVDIARIADSAVTFAKMQDVGTGVLIGRNDSGSGVMETLTAAEVRTLINVEDGATAGGGGSAGLSTDAQGNLVAGYNAGANFSGTDAEHNILIGYEAGNAITTADNNVAIGYEALKSVDTESGNTAVGYRALKEVTGMGYNVAVGYEAGYYTYSMYECVAVGFQAMSKPTQSGTTWYSVAIGANAMAACGGDRCVAVGNDALDGNNASGADDNTAIGNESLFSVGTNALKNTAVGSLSGKATTSGDENVYIGYNAGNNAHTTGNNCIIIGNNAAATSSGISSEITLGDTNINKFRIPGIGVTFTSTTGNSFSSDGQFVTSRWTVANNGSSNYTFTGPGGLSAASNSTLYLARGQTYEFNMNASGHGFGIQTSSGGWNASNEYTTGITNAKAAVGVIKFEVPFSAPNTLYYACTAGHGGMVGSLVIYPSI